MPKSPQQLAAVYVSELDVQELHERYGLAQLAPTSANELRFCQAIVGLERECEYQEGLVAALKQRIADLEELFNQPPSDPASPPAEPTV